MILMNRIEKIENMKLDRLELYRLVKESISNNNISYRNDTEELTKALYEEEQTSKKYSSIVKAQELVVSLSQEIMEAKTPEEIIALRKKLNYYINKIKTEIKKRNISEEELSKYQDNASHLRKDISTLLRYSKREVKLNEIDELNSRENLSKEDKKYLGKLISTERRYNRVNLHPEIYKKPKKKKENNFLKELSFKLEKSPVPVYRSEFLQQDAPIEEIENYVEEKVSCFRQQYNIEDSREYSGSKIKNLFIFFQNIPVILRNRKKIQSMVVAHNIFYSGDDLGSYIEYMSRKNSIRNNIRNILSRSYLLSDESKYLNDHTKCVEWIIDYCKYYDLTLSGVRMGSR